MKTAKQEVFLTDLSKAFDGLNHNILIPKLNAYELDRESLSFLCSYLQNKKQMTKVNTSYSRFSEIISRVPQGFTLGPLFYSIYTYVTPSMKAEIWILLVMLTTILHKGVLKN